MKTKAEIKLILHTVYKCAACQTGNQGFRKTEYGNEVSGRDTEGPFFCIFRIGKKMVQLLLRNYPIMISWEDRLMSH